VLEVEGLYGPPDVIVHTQTLVQELAVVGIHHLQLLVVVSEAE
jgi:hypothetical protein